MPPFPGLMATPAFQAEIGDRRMAADREHHLVGSKARAVRQMRGEFLAVPIDLRHRAAGENGDALFFHLAADVGANVLVETAQDVVTAIDHGDVGAVAGEDAGEFQRDIAAALDHDPLRQLLQMERLVGGDHVLDAGDRGAVVGRAAGGDQDVFCGDLPVVLEQADGVLVLDHRATLDDLRARLLDIRRVGRFQPRDLLVLVGDQRRPVEGRGRNGPAETGGIFQLVTDMRADHEQLLRHAAADHAGPAHAVLFRDHHARTVTGRDAGGTHAARAATDDKEVDVEFSHCPLRPLFSA